MKFSSQFTKMGSVKTSGTFEILKLERYFEEPIPGDPLILPKSRHIIFWVWQGNGEVAIDLDRNDITIDTLYYVRPGQALEITLNEPSQGFLITFEVEFLPLLEKDFGLSYLTFPGRSGKRSSIPIQNEAREFLKKIADEMVREYAHYYDLRTEILSSYVKIFMVYLRRNCDAAEVPCHRSAGSELAMLFLSMLDKRFADKKMVKDYADELAVTPGYLNKVIKDVTGFKASHHIQQRIVMEAKRKVVFERHSLKEIAYTLGFCDPAHFSKFFKNGAGTNFTHFKKTALNFPL